MTHAAKQTAIDVARDNGIKTDAPRMIDADHGAPCFEIMPGLIVYEDEPDCVCSVEWRADRFIPG